MTGLISVLSSISLLDSVSMIPTAIVPMLIMLGGRRPILTAMMFIIGVFVAYFGVGLLIVFGVATVIDQATTGVKRWMSNPYTPELIIQIVLGVVMLAFAFKLGEKREEKRKKQPPPDFSPWGAWTFGALLMLSGIWGALPYFAAIDEIFRADLSTAGGTMALLYYNVVFIAPLAAIIVIRAAAGARSDAFFDKLNAFFARWTKRVVVIVLFLLGLLLIADGIAWLMGNPFLPVPSA